MTGPRIDHTPSRAYVAVFWLVFLTGCGAPSEVAVDNDEAKSSAAAQPQAVSAPVSTAPERPAAETPAGAVDDVEGKPAESATASNEANGGATLAGRVVWDGPPPKRRVINMTKDAECVKLHGDKPVLNEDVIVSDDGGVMNAFVYVRRGAPDIEYPVPEEPYLLDQKDCMYRPRVGGVRVGQTLLVSNSDPVTHNVRSYPIRNRAFNFGQPADTAPRERIFEQPEREVDVQCDIHPWMRAFFFIMDHPFFGVTDDAGTYTIDDLPPGEYTLAVWHEKFGKQQQKITVGDGDLGDVDFTYKP